MALLGDVTLLGEVWHFYWNCITEKEAFRLYMLKLYLVWHTVSYCLWINIYNSQFLQYYGCLHTVMLPTMMIMDRTSETVIQSSLNVFLYKSCHVMLSLHSNKTKLRHKSTTESRASTLIGVRYIWFLLHMYLEPKILPCIYFLVGGLVPKSSEWSS